MVVICQALLASHATAFSSLANTWQVSRTWERHSWPSARPCPRVPTIGSAGILWSGASYLPRGSSTALKAAAARRAASASFFRKAKSSHPWWQLVWTKMTTIGSGILGEFQRLTWKQQFLLLAVFLAGISIGKSLSTLTLSRFRHIDDIPPTFFGPSAPYLQGRAVSVSDGDTFRFYHTPTYFHKSTLDKKKERLVDNTLLVRICTIDTPETAKFGKPAQPFAEQAKQELQRLIEDRIVHVRLLTKDQYGRVVGQVMVSRPGARLGKLFSRKLSIEEVMLQAGLAEVYQGMGAAYGHKGKDFYLALERQAQQSKKGMWALSKRESAADYKRRTRKEK